MTKPLRLSTILFHDQQSVVWSMRFVVAFFLAGGSIGLFAWPGQMNSADTLQFGVAQLNVSLLFILLLPVWWTAARSRWQIAALYAGYVLAGTRDLPAVYGAFFPGTSIAFGALGWLLQAAVLSLPWAIMWRPNMTLFAASWRLVAVILLLSFPPFGFIGWLNPLVLAGYLYPGAGWGGVLQLLLLFSMIVVLCYRMTAMRLGIAALLVISSLWTVLHYQRPAAPEGWMAMSTRMGAHPPVADLTARFAYHQKLIGQVTDALEQRRSTVFILPEDIAGTWLPSTRLWWQPVADLANSRRKTVLVGADRYVDNNQHFYNSIVDIGRSEIVTTDRFPMPVGQWRPWTAPSAIMSPLKNNVFMMDHQWVALSVCYEDFLFWLQAQTMWHGKPAVMVSIANNWFAGDAAEPWIQARHIQLWADLWGLPLLRAVNR